MQKGLCVYIDENLLTKFTEKTKKNGISKTESVRNAIAAYVYSDDEDDALALYKRLYAETQSTLDRLITQFGGK